MADPKLPQLSIDDADEIGLGLGGINFRFALFDHVIPPLEIEARDEGSLLKNLLDSIKDFGLGFFIERRGSGWGGLTSPGLGSWLASGLSLGDAESREGQGTHKFDTQRHDKSDNADSAKMFARFFSWADAVAGIRLKWP